MVWSVQPRFFGIPHGEGHLVEVGTGKGETDRLAFGVMSLGRSTRHKAAVSRMRRQAKALQEDMGILEPEDDGSEQDDEA
jgi:hypothetical protein